MFTNTREFKVWSLDMASSASDRWLADDGLQASGFIGAPARNATTRRQEK